ncbi:DUF1214 domain-containing protein [Nocardioides marmoriginsengisoli]|uniref:DUF1214 domain-containing protein n=1 Tax=Nocardioides marmoriginsengisoli TaxID=661483 RepID=A0A3N0CNB9_9ACTN|nr:DUF1214 domain-containing protein [Nocardioides marmoriginsengisoli]RNL64964.1 DUF1214 domain-containing protein [Nocardioides marmoriginsengisoli]
MNAAPENRWESTAAWNELLAGLGELQDVFLTGDRAVSTETGVVNGYRMLATILGVGLDIYLYPEKSRPVWVDTVTPFRRDRRWGGDNTDAAYGFTVFDPERTYRIWGTRNDSAYFSVTVYNEPSPGAWSDKVIGVVNDSDLDFDDDGGFSFYLGARKPAGYDGPWIEFTPDTAAALTRDYQADPLTGKPVEWHIECLDEPDPVVRSDAATAQALRSTLSWMRTMFMIVPMSIQERTDEVRLGLGHQTPDGVNTVAEPYRVPDFNFGWSATDATYCFGSYDLQPDEALVISYRPPNSFRFWNFMPWTEYMAGHNAADGKTSLNNHTAVPNSDGTVTIVISRSQLAHPNAVTTLDNQRGMIAFRWFLADEVPAKPVVTLVKAVDAPVAIT